MNGPSSRGPIGSDRSSDPSSTVNGGKRDRSGSLTPGPSETNSASVSFNTDDERAALASAVDDLNRATRIFDRRFEFRVHEATNRVIVDVYDRETDELIREIPPEKILDALAKMQELLGLLFDERV